MPLSRLAIGVTSGIVVHGPSPLLLLFGQEPGLRLNVRHTRRLHTILNGMLDILAPQYGAFPSFNSKDVRVWITIWT